MGQTSNNDKLRIQIQAAKIVLDNARNRGDDLKADLAEAALNNLLDILYSNSGTEQL